MMRLVKPVAEARLYAFLENRGYRAFRDIGDQQLDGVGPDIDDGAACGNHESRHLPQAGNERKKIFKTMRLRLCRARQDRLDALLQLGENGVYRSVSINDRKVIIGLQAFELFLDQRLVFQEGIE